MLIATNFKKICYLKLLHFFKKALFSEIPEDGKCFLSKSIVKDRNKNVEKKIKFNFFGLKNSG